MTLLRRLWAWLRSLWVKPEDDAHDALMAWQTAERRSANICLASRGATKREKANAHRYLSRIYLKGS